MGKQYAGSPASIFRGSMLWDGIIPEVFSWEKDTGYLCLF